MPKSKTQTKPKYEPVLKLPPLSYEAFTALKDNIAVNGVLVPILVDSNGPRRKIIDGNYRKQIAHELGYDCPEIVKDDLEEDEKRTLCRALNLARRHLKAEEKRALIEDQLRETPDKSLRWVAKMLGVHHTTVGSVRGEMQSTGELASCPRTEGQDGKYRPTKPMKTVPRSAVERKARIGAVTLIHGDCRKELKKIGSGTIDAIISDPIYPEINREYGRISEAEWHSLMREVVAESRRILKPKGSAVFIFQPNYDKIGKMRLWMWEFMVWAGREMGLIQDVYWWNIDCLPLAGTNRKYGLLRQSVKTCIWLGSPDCYRNQDEVLWTASLYNSARHRADIALRKNPSGRTYRNSSFAKAADERGGTTPFNLLPISVGGQSGGGHPSSTCFDVAAWWCKYILPPDGVLLDPFVGSGTMLQAGLDHGASKVIGIDREKKYLTISKQRITNG